MKGFSKSVNNRNKQLWKRKQIGYGPKPVTSEKFKNKFEKVKKGVYHIPSFVPPEAQDLIRGMICTDPVKRLKLDDVLKHQVA